MRRSVEVSAPNGMHQVRVSQDRATAKGVKQSVNDMGSAMHQYYNVEGGKKVL